MKAVHPIYPLPPDRPIATFNCLVSASRRRCLCVFIAPYMEYFYLKSLFQLTFEPFLSTGKTGSGSQIQVVPQRAQRTKLESETHHANIKTTAQSTAHSTGFHRSMGNLHDDQESSVHLTSFHHSTGNLPSDQKSVSPVVPLYLSTGQSICWMTFIYF